MSIAAIGSSFSYIPPEGVGRAAPAAAESEAPTSATEAGEGSEASERPQASGRSGGSVADELRAAMVKSQETSATPPSPRAAARAYGGA